MAIHYSINNGYNNVDSELVWVYVINSIEITTLLQGYNSDDLYSILNRPLDVGKNHANKNQIEIKESY